MRLMTPVLEVPSTASSPKAAAALPHHEARAPLADYRDRSNSVPSKSIRGDRAHSILPEQEPAGARSSHEGSSTDNAAVEPATSSPLEAGDTEFPPTPSFQANRFRSKPGPNLRIAVGQDESKSPNRRPPPPPKSPKQAESLTVPGGPVKDQRSLSLGVLPSPTRKQSVGPSAPLPPSTPTRLPRPSTSRPSTSHQTQASCSGPDVGTGDSPSSIRSGRAASAAGITTMPRPVAGELAAKPLPPIRLSSASRFAASSTSALTSITGDNSSILNAPVSPLSTRFATRPGLEDLPPPSPVSQFLQPAPSPRAASFSPPSPRTQHYSPPSPKTSTFEPPPSVGLRNVERLEEAVRGYEVVSKGPASPPSSRHGRTESGQDPGQDLRSKKSMPALSSSMPNRKPLPPRSLSSSVGSVQVDAHGNPQFPSGRPEITDAMSRVLAAKANIASLNSSDPAPTILPNADLVRSPVSEAPSMSRLATPASLRKKGSLTTLIDPAATLKELAEQTEALQARYANLRVERQKISSSMVAKLKEQRPGPEYANLLLDEQLSLAAVSSSMDICFAKLKALDCRKEEAIAALIAQSRQPTGGRKGAASNVSSMMSYASASSRKYSMGPSTGRLTSEFSDTDASEYRQHQGKLSVSSNGDGYRPKSADSVVPPSLPESAQRSGMPPLTPVHERPATSSESTRDTDDSVRSNSTHTSVDEVQEIIPPEQSAFTDSDSEVLADELFGDEPKKIVIDAAKAAKLLSLLARANNRKGSKSSGDGDDADLDFPELEFEVYSSSRSKQKKASKPTSAPSAPPTAPPTKKAPNSATATPKKSALRTTTPTPQTPNATVIENFPMPKAMPPILQARKYEAPLPALPPIPGWQENSDSFRTRRVADTATERGNEQQQHDDEQGLSFKEKAKRRGYSAQTIQTIQVYMDDDEATTYYQ